MKKFIIPITLFFLALSQISCSAITSAIADITSLDCDEWLLEESSSDLNELCRDLEGYLDTDTSSLEEAITEALPTANLTSTHDIYVHLTDANGVAADINAVGVEYSSDGTTWETIEDTTFAPLSEATELKASLTMVLDYSGSITDSDLTDVNSGLHLFFDNLIADATSTAYQSAIIKFSTDVDLIQDYTRTKADLLTAVDDDSYERDVTSLYDAIYDGITASAAENTGLKLVIAFTDGLDNDSEHTQEDVIAYATENDVPVCIVGVGFANVDTLRTIAEDTGCFFIYKTFFTSLDSAFDLFADQIDNFTVVHLPDSFTETTGSLRITADVSSQTAREVIVNF